MPDRDIGKADSHPKIDAVELATRWGLIVLSALAALGALLRTFGPGPLSLPERVDQTTLLYLSAAGGLLLLRQIKTFTMGQLKFEMIERLREQQERQGEKIAEFDLILPLLLPDKEVRHIRNLFAKQTEKYQGSSPLREELRRLRSIGLIAKKPDRNIGDIRDGLLVDLSDYVELTELGRRWAVKLQDLRAGDAKPPDERHETAIA